MAGTDRLIGAAGRMTFSRVMCLVFLANIGCMVLCNLLSLPTWSIIPLYPVCIVSGWLLLRRVQLRRPRVVISGGMVLAVVLGVLLLAAIRLPYVMEWIPGNTVHVQFDDHARVAELAGMTLDRTYPLVSPFSRRYLLSFYYAALYPMAWLKMAVPVLTIKDAIFLGSLFYDTVFLFGLLEIGAQILSSLR